MNSFQAAQRDISALTGPYEAVQQAGLALKQTADQASRRSIDDELSALERQWLDLDSHLRDSSRRLEFTVGLWDDVEAAMETVLERLKETRSSLAKPIPIGYDDLRKELRHCQVCDLACYVRYGSVLNLF